MDLARLKLSRRAAGLVLLTFASRPAAAQESLMRVAPEQTDPRITRYTNADNWVFFNPAASPAANLLVFLPGTSPNRNGVPFDRFQQFFQTAISLGYQVIALQYDNNPAVAQICPRDPDPNCSAAFREKRTFGDDVTRVIDDVPPESIVNRLSSQLAFLADRFPDQGWNRYMTADGPNWDRIAFTGHSQGAGMAAYIGKRQRVARVALLSGPWDFTDPGQVPAPWLSEPSATPPDRWYALRHAQERQSAALRAAYAALRIPPSHLRVLDLPPLEGNRVGPRNDVFHISVVSDLATPRGPGGEAAYRPDWAFVLGRSP
jgi:predicted esterase